MGRSAYDFEAHAHRNLRKYLRNFELPKPPPGEIDSLYLRLPEVPLPKGFKADVRYGKSHENDELAVRHEKWRVLENIRRLNIEGSQITAWLDFYIPVAPIHLNTNSDGRYSLPQKLGDVWVNLPSEIDEMLNWLCLPLITVTRVLHSSFPNTCSQQFNEIPDRRDQSRFRYLVWNGPDGSVHVPQQGRGPGSLIVAYQTPYILTQQDMLDFVSCTSFPDFNKQTRAELPAKYRLWAKIWDACTMWSTEMFVLTSYTQWVFGTFSSGGTVAFISDIIQYDSTSPTILEFLTYWIASALQMPASFVRPKVDEPIPDEDIDMEPTTEKIPKAPRSESAWRGQSEAPGESAVEDLRSVLSGESSLKSVFGAEDGNSIGKVKEWITHSRNAKHRRLDEDDLFAPLMPESELDVFRPNQPLGQWMVSS